MNNVARGNAPNPSGNSVPAPRAESLDIHRVTWLDSTLTNEQVGSEDLPHPSTVDSVGWLVEQNDEYVTIARERIGREWRGLICIPQASVLCHTQEHAGRVADSAEVAAKKASALRDFESLTSRVVTCTLDIVSGPFPPYVDSRWAF